MSENIVLVKNAFEEETPVTSPVLSTAGLERQDLVEFGTLFDTIAIPDSIVRIANTNELNITWKELQTILNSIIAEQCQLVEEKVKDETTKTMVESLTSKITYSINEHSNCPFTIQRLCELIIEPKKYYKMFVKYLRAIDKVLSVTSYWEDYVSTENAEGKTEDENMEEVKTEEVKTDEENTEEVKTEEVKTEEVKNEEVETEEVNMEEVKVEEKTEEKTEEKAEEKIEEKTEEKTEENADVKMEEEEEIKIEGKSLPIDNDLGKPTKIAKMDLD